MEGPNVRTYLNYVGGEWIPSEGEVLESRNPATGEIVARAPLSTSEDVRVAISEARRSFDSGEWSQSKPAERGALLRGIAEAIRSDIEELSVLLTLENGKPLADAKGELLNAATVFEYFSSAARHVVGRVPRYGASDVSLVVQEPVGVCALIVPWNSPISLLSWKLGPALAAGCSVIIKPSEYTPAITMEFLKRLDKMKSLPRGVVNAVTGPGGTVGAELVRSSDVDKVSFTGSTETGRRIMEAASSNLKKVNLECGGKSTCMVFDDARMESAIPGALWSIFRSAGQSCNAGSRLLVQDTIYDSFMSGFRKAAAAIRVGNGLQADTEMGPLISDVQLKRVLGYVESGISGGAKLTLGGHQITEGDFAKGFFVQPTIFEGVDVEMKIFREEIFGPVLCAMPFHDAEEAVRISNQTNYGLAGDLWSRDIQRIMKVCQGVRTGTLWVNRHLNPGPEVPFGGYKQSGIGRETGMEGLAEYLQVKHISLQLSDSNERVRR